MRVAIIAMSLLSIIAGVSVTQAQVSQATEGTTFAGAVPMAMHNPSFTVPELAVPVVSTPAMKRSVVRRSTIPAAKLTTLQASRFSLSVPSPRSVGPRTPAVGATQTAQPRSRSMTDHLLAGVVALMLIAYQLRRKHRVLRPHPFTN